MKMQYKNLSISSTALYDEPAPWCAHNFNNYRITAVNQDTKKRISFPFWSSLAEPQISTKRQLIRALECFLGDALSGRESYDDFCREFAYDEDSHSAERVWKSCQKSTSKALALLGDEQAIEELYTNLQKGDTK